MNYEFPKILHLDDVLPAIEGHDEFSVKRDVANDMVIVNYKVSFVDTFQDPNEPGISQQENLYRRIRRECRGITFRLSTGEILSRKFHKFFNYGERAETLPEAVDFSKPHVVLDKLDGSMLSPIMVDNSVRWCTKMGLTDVSNMADAFLATHPQYNDFAKAMIEARLTPLFEFCSRKNRIVVDHPVDRLVLLAIRDLDGKYDSYEVLQHYGKIYNIEVVRALPGSVENVEKFMKDVDDLKGAEGYVIRFANGHMLKVKGAEYRQLHKVLDQLTFEKDVVALIVDDKIDDAKPLLAADIAAKLDAFQTDLLKNIEATADEVYSIAASLNDLFEGNRKQMAQAIMKNHRDLSSLIFKTLDNLSDGPDAAFDLIKSTISKNTGSSGNITKVRNLFGNIYWDRYYHNVLDE